MTQISASQKNWKLTWKSQSFHLKRIRKYNISPTKVSDGNAGVVVKATVFHIQQAATDELSSFA